MAGAEFDLLDELATTGGGTGLDTTGFESPSQKKPTMAMMAAATTKPIRSSGLKRRLLDMTAVTVTDSEALASNCTACADFVSETRRDKAPLGFVECDHEVALRSFNDAGRCFHGGCC